MFNFSRNLTISKFPLSKFFKIYHYFTNIKQSKLLFHGFQTQIIFSQETLGTLLRMEWVPMAWNGVGDDKNTNKKESGTMTFHG
jgi:hypothetical protein